MRLKFAFLLFGMFAALLAGGVFIVNSFYDLKNIQTENAILHLNNIALDKQEDLSNFLDLQKAFLNDLSKNEILLNFVEKHYKGENLLQEDKKDVLTLFNNQDVDALVIDDKGDVIISSREDGYLSGKILWGTYKIEDNQEFNFYIYYDDIIQKDFLAASKHFNTTDGNFVNLVFEISLDGLEKIMSLESEDFIPIYGERAYIVNEDYSLITSIKFPDKKLKDNLLVQTIDTLNSEECFEHINEKVHHGLGAIPYIDFRGEEVFGTHIFVPEANWCIIIEADKSKIYDSFYLTKNLYLLLGLIVLIGFFGFLFGDLLKEIYLDRFNKNRKLKKLSGKTLPIHAYLVFAAVFFFVFGFLLILFIGLFEEMNLFDNLPDLAFLILSFILFRISFNLISPLGRGFISFGAVSLILYKMFEISLGIYQSVSGILHWGFWASSYSFYVIGTILLLKGFWEVFK